MPGQVGIVGAHVGDGGGMNLRLELRIGSGVLDAAGEGIARPAARHPCAPDRRSAGPRPGGVRGPPPGRARAGPVVACRHAPAGGRPSRCRRCGSSSSRTDSASLGMRSVEPAAGQPSSSTMSTSSSPCPCRPRSSGQPEECGDPVQRGDREHGVCFTVGGCEHRAEPVPRTASVATARTAPASTCAGRQRDAEGRPPLDREAASTRAGQTPRPDPHLARTRVVEAQPRCRSCPALRRHDRHRGSRPPRAVARAGPHRRG